LSGPVLDFWNGLASAEVDGALLKLKKGSSFHSFQQLSMTKGSSLPGTYFLGEEEKGTTLLIRKCCELER
jgi:hypothetical protein